jgi:molecular chaperone GrpE
MTEEKEQEIKVEGDDMDTADIPVDGMEKSEDPEDRIKDAEAFQTQDSQGDSSDDLNDADSMTSDNVMDSDSEATSHEEAGSSASEGSEENAGQNRSKDKKPIFGKKNDKELEKLKDKLKELEDRSVRQLAEFQNFRNRTEKEKSQMFDTGERNVVEKILPVVDSFERGLAGVDENTDDPFIKGMLLVYKQMMKALTDLGVEPIDAVGKPFDPNFHSAVMMVDDETKESGTVAEELQKGYMMNGQVVRFSMVKVVN